MSNKIQLPNGYKPSESEEYMNPMQVEYFKQKLLDWKESLIKESEETIDHLKDNNLNEPDLNDRASAETEASLDLRTKNRYFKLMKRIDDALDRIQDGSYGYSEESGDPIGLKRLEARPIATLSLEEQERHERYEKSHSED